MTLYKKIDRLVSDFDVMNEDGKPSIIWAEDALTELRAIKGRICDHCDGDGWYFAVDGDEMPCRQCESTGFKRQVPL